ncbi:hypothetical protein A9Z40_02015 [Microbacterium arborescens]|uniref:TrbL/VirB6 plasmid conjugal transfer protein n=1 Tax=Microbacterium arborescens TaxID=33883 RepID=A0ABX2WJG1_9MICO|nr:hypothetical protein [Microbacterium arborescens]OAZ41475.1 hypothetical protein A9Z40_02015 [Microbacterium arborescens]
MSLRVRLLALVLIVVGLVAGSGMSASAWDGASTARSQQLITTGTADRTPVTDERWSAPAVPVKCYRTGDTVFCTPENSDETVERACFFNVPSASGPLTVCSMAAANQSVLDDAGKKLDYQWGCGFADVPCMFLEGTAETLSAEAINMVSRAQSALGFNTNSHLWTTAVSEWSFWAWAVLILVLIAGIIAVTQAAVTGGTPDVLQALLRFGLTVPLTQACLWLLGTVLNSLDLLTQEIFATSDVFGTMTAMLFGGGKVFPLSGVLNTGVVAVTAALMFVVLLVRNIGLAGLILAMPIAWMLFPIRSVGRTWVTAYVSAVAALLLTGPLMLSLFRFLGNGLSTVSSIWDPAIWPYMLGMIIVCFAPFAVFTLFSFAGGSVIDGAAAGVGRGAASMAGRVTRSIPKPRVGTPPAGGGGSGGGTAGRATRTAKGAAGGGGGSSIPKGPTAPSGTSRAGTPPAGGGTPSAPSTHGGRPAPGGGVAPPSPPRPAAPPAGGGGTSTQHARPPSVPPVSGPSSPNGVRR